MMTTTTMISIRVKPRLFFSSFIVVSQCTHLQSSLYITVSILTYRTLFFKHGHDARRRAVGTFERQRQRREAEGGFEGELPQSAQVFQDDHAVS